MTGGLERWCLRCRDAGEECTLTIGGTYEEVLEEGAAHFRRAHGAHGGEAEVREAVAELLRRQETDWLWPPQAQGGGDKAMGRPDWPF